MQYLELAPPALLASVVQCFWFLRGDLTGAPAETIVPDGRMEIILHLGEPFAEVDGAGVSRGQAPALAAGQLTTPLRIQPRGYSDIIGIRLEPAGAKSLLRVPIHELGNAVTPLADVAPRFLARLIDAVAYRARAEDRARSVAQVLAGQITREPPAEVCSAVRILGQLRPPAISVLARQLGMSRRTLERRVREETGLSPRTLRQVFRFRRAFRMLDRRPPGEWSRLAIRAGYFDQAHLIRDFHRFAGAAPTGFFRDDPALSRVLTSTEEPAA